MYEWLPAGIELLTDTSEAGWIARRLLPLGHGGSRVGLFMPQGFAAYARILHPAGGRGGDLEGLRWAEVASRLSKPFDPDVQFGLLADGEVDNHPTLGDVAPMEGSLPLRLLRSLVTLLEGWTEERQPCCFAMWEGNGTWWKGAHGGGRFNRFDDERDAVLTRTPRFELHAGYRRYFLMRGSLADVVPLREAAGGQTPALWWPGDRSWLVSTEVDSFSTYVGGAADLIAKLSKSHEIEAVPSRLDAPLDWGR
jgi:hypothetical protein